jgi:hypothetical protein
MGHYLASPQRLHLALGSRRSRQIHIANRLDHGLFGPCTRGQNGDRKRTCRGQTRYLRCRRYRRGFLGCRFLSETTHSQVVCDLAAAAAGRGRVAYASPQNVSQSFPKLCRGTCLQPYRHFRSQVPAGAKNGSAKASTGMRHPGFAYHELFIFAHVVRRRGLEFRAIRRWCLRYGYADAIFGCYCRPQVLTLRLEPCLKPWGVTSALVAGTGDLAAVTARRSSNVEKVSSRIQRCRAVEDSLSDEKFALAHGSTLNTLAVFAM